MSAETTQGVECACHPECEASCRVEQHPVDEPCLWPDCLSVAEMRAALVQAREAGVL